MALLKTKYFINYVRTQKAVLNYTLANSVCPVKISENAKVALEELRKYLDRKGYRLPLPQYYYNSQDNRTWKYLPSNTKTQNINLFCHNPNFKY